MDSHVTATATPKPTKTPKPTSSAGAGMGAPVVGAPPKGAALPSTGSSVSTSFALGGLVLVLMGGLVVVAGRRRRH